MKKGRAMNMEAAFASLAGPYGEGMPVSRRWRPGISRWTTTCQEQFQLEYAVPTIKLSSRNGSTCSFSSMEPSWLQQRIQPGKFRCDSDQLPSCLSAEVQRLYMVNQYLGDDIRAIVDRPDWKIDHKIVDNGDEAYSITCWLCRWKGAENKVAVRKREKVIKGYEIEGCQNEQKFRSINKW